MCVRAYRAPAGQWRARSDGDRPRSLRSISDAVTVPCWMDAASRRISSQCALICFMLTVPPMSFSNVCGPLLRFRVNKSRNSKL